MIDDAKKRFKDMKFFEKWTRRKISSFDYLMLINKYASRSFNDTSQYPIMPWVGPCGVQNFDEITEALTETKKVFNNKPQPKVRATNLLTKKERKQMKKGLVRDLTKNSAILHQTKEQKAISTYANGPELMEAEIYGEEKYHQKFSYMNSQICLSYLVRVEPYASLFIQYNGKLDHSDRMFGDCIGQWKKVFEGSLQCNSELIPEWFYLPQIYLNNNF